MINVEIPCRIEEKISEKSGKSYIMVTIKIDEDYEMKLFPSNEQQAVIRMAARNSKQKFKVSNTQQD